MDERKTIIEIAPADLSEESRFGYRQLEGLMPGPGGEIIIREEYAKRMASAEVIAKGRCFKPAFIGYNYDWAPNSEQAWFCQKAEGMTLFPLFPFLQYFLDFGDPFRKIAVLIEEKANPWTDDKALIEQERLLRFSGWRIFRITDVVANTYEENVLPEHLSRCPYGEFEDDDQFEEYQSWKPELERTTIDGFFRWLKKEYYSYNTSKDQQE